jgi:hypothetical protein
MRPILRHPGAVLLLVLAAAAANAATPTPSAAEPALDRVAFHAAWIGKWSGTLEYRDYSPPHGLVRLPTTLEVQAADDGRALRLDFLYDDGPTKKVRSSDLLRLDAAAGTLDWDSADGESRQRFAVVESSPARLVVRRTGEDDDKPAEIRETLEFDGRTIRIVKETAIAGGERQLRHHYSFERVD